jgi:hypothetical protein
MASNPKDPKAETAAATGAGAAAPIKKNEAKDIKEPKEKNEVKDFKEPKEKDGKDSKDHKDQKEHKDQKDQKEHKEHKDQKDQKDTKEHKETKDHKEQKDHKDHIKEHKWELKDQQKDIDKQAVKPEKDIEKQAIKPEFEKIEPEHPKDLVEGQLGPGNIVDPAFRANVEQRLATLEGKVATFIPDSSRPDLRMGALKNEPDRSGGGGGTGG